MYIGVDRKGIIISVDNYYDTKAFEIKVVKEQQLDIEHYDYKYSNGKIINLGLKPEFAMTDKEKILKELEELDTVINRATEDLYALTNTTPYKSTQEVITRKEELRKELKTLSEGEDSNEKTSL